MPNFFTSLIPSTIYAISINKYLLFARHCAWAHKVKLYNPEIKKFALIKILCKQIHFYKIIDTKESLPRAVGEI